MEAAELHDLTAAYALDALDGDERRAYEEHLESCGRCQEDLRTFSETASALAYGVDAPPPPAALRERILEEARAERRTVVPLRSRPARSRRVAQWAFASAAAAAALAVGIGIWAVTLARDLEREREAREILAHPQAESIALSGAQGRLVVTEAREAALVVQGLGPAPEGQTYEIWVIDDDRPVPAGLFDAGEGTEVVRLREPVPPGSTVAVTVEPAGGVEQPTGEPILSAEA